MLNVRNRIKVINDDQYSETHKTVEQKEVI